MKQVDEFSFYAKVLAKECERLFNRNFASYGLTGEQCKIIGYIHCYEKQGITASDLQKASKKSQATISGILSRLVENGFVVYETNPKDSRRKYLRLTDQSKEFLKEIEKNIQECEIVLTRGLSEEEVMITKQSLKKMIQNIEEYRRNEK